MEFAAILVFNCVAIAVGTGLGLLIRQRHRHYRLVIVGILALVLGMFASSLGSGLPTLPLPWLPALGAGLYFAAGAFLLLGLLGLAWLNRWLPFGILLALYGVDIKLLFGFSPGHGWGLIAVPPLLAGLLIGTTRADRRGMQGALVLGWALLLLCPATMMLMNVIDQFEWEIARADTGYYRDLPAESIAVLTGVAHQREVAATALYLLVTVGTLGLVWVALLERLIDSPRRMITRDRNGTPLHRKGSY